MTQERLSALALLSIEQEVCTTLDIKDIVKFSETKARKVRFQNFFMLFSYKCFILLDIYFFNLETSLDSAGL